MPWLAKVAPWFVLLCAACSFQPAPAFPRPALPLPADARERYRLPGPVELRRHDDAQGAARDSHGELACGDETVRFHLCRAGRDAAPLVLLVPILGGGADLMRTVARRFVALGFDAAWCDRAGPALRPPQRGADLERMLQRTVVHQRILLHWLIEESGLDSPAVYACGFSLGGIVTAMLSAVEPRLRAAAMCLAGADLPTILCDSNEPRIARWRSWRHDEDGLLGQCLHEELARELCSDPLRLGPHVQTDKVLLVAAKLDDVVRPEHQDLLWESLGRPERLSLPLGHYSAALALGPMLDAIATFFHDRVADTGGPRPMARR